MSSATATTASDPISGYWYGEDCPYDWVTDMTGNHRFRVIPGELKHDAGNGIKESLPAFYEIVMDGILRGGNREAEDPGADWVDGCYMKNYIVTWTGRNRRDTYALNAYDFRYLLEAAMGQGK